MKTSTDRILTTHVGGLPRPADLLSARGERDRRAYDPAAFDACLAKAVRGHVGGQVASGIDSVSDGEHEKEPNFYVRHRLPASAAAHGGDTTAASDRGASRILDHPDFTSALNQRRAGLPG